MTDKIRQTYQMLEDESSKETYLAWFNYLITGDAKHLDKLIKNMPQVLLPYDILVSNLIQSLPQDKKSYYMDQEAMEGLICIILRMTTDSLDFVVKILKNRRMG